MNVRLSNLLGSIVIAATASLPLMASASPVKTISLEVFKDAKVPFWEVSVSCENVTSPRTMSKAIDGSQWCSTDIASMCNDNKFSLSRQLCNDNFSQQIVDFKNGKPLSQPDAETATIATKANNENAPAELVSTTQKTGAKEQAKIANNANSDDDVVTGRNNLLKEQMQIEEQRILIQQKRLELRRRELALQKRQLSAS